MAPAPIAPNCSLGGYRKFVVVLYTYIYIYNYIYIYIPQLRTHNGKVPPSSSSLSAVVSLFAVPTTLVTSWVNKAERDKDDISGGTARVGELKIGGEQRRAVEEKIEVYGELEGECFARDWKDERDTESN